VKNLSRSDIPLSEAIARIIRKKGFIALCLAIGTAVGTLIAFTARSVFVSEIVILPQSDNSQGGGGGIAKKLSGLASAAGIALGGNQENDSRDAAIATLSSYQTLSTFLAHEGIQKTVLTESSRWNPLATLGQLPHQSMWEAVREFKDRMIVTQEKDSSLVRVSFEWYDPVSASRWTNDLVALVDAGLRMQALNTAKGRITYLQKELENNPVVPVREVIAGMMENELRTMATAGADKEFAFRIIDPAIPAERPTRPKKLLIMAAFAFCGLFFGSIVAVLFDRSRTTSDKNTGSNVEPDDSALLR
jgi:uncharacterized protein involved in exopolysaccharide biosynthesis